MMIRIKQLECTPFAIEQAVEECIARKIIDYRKITAEINEKYGWNVQERVVYQLLEPDAETLEEDARRMLKQNYGLSPYGES